MQQSKDHLNLPEPFASIPRTHLLFPFSTPIEYLPRLSNHLSPNSKLDDGEPNIKVFIKREDVNSGIAFGGNKVRKLEYLIPDAIQRGCDTLVSIGGVQSNHTRAVAGVAAKLGLGCELVQEHWVPIPSTPSYAHYDKVGNLQTSYLLGATIHRSDESFSIEHKPTLQSLTTRLTSEGKKPYYIPGGASDHPLGGLGFARWAFEVVQQEKDMGNEYFETVVVCAVTGSTLAGIIAGFKLADRSAVSRKWKRRIIGIDASAKPAETKAQTLRIARDTAVKIGLKEEDITEEDVELDERFHEGVYGIAGEGTKQAMRLAARLEGVVTDPVYEGKSMAGLIEIIQNGELRGRNAERRNVLYVHLGGQMANSAYADL